MAAFVVVIRHQPSQPVSHLRNDFVELFESRLSQTIRGVVVCIPKANQQVSAIVCRGLSEDVAVDPGSAYCF
ncbi:MAG TPA: hypothetical protein VGD94_21995, partial [Vicinamibacterales bacterium]